MYNLIAEKENFINNLSNDKIFRKAQKRVKEIFKDDANFPYKGSELKRFRESLLNEVKEMDFKQILALKNDCYKNAGGYRGYENSTIFDKGYLKIKDNLRKYVYMNVLEYEV